MTDFDTELSDLKNRYPEHFDEWLRREKAESAQHPVTKRGVPFDLSTYKTLGLV